MAASKVTLKLLMDQTGKKVLFAEAGKDFVDFLFSILALPLGTVVRLLSAKEMVGCLGDLYESIENLSSIYMQPNQSKASVLKPRARIFGAQVSPLLPNAAYSSSSFYKCVDYLNYNCQTYVAEDPNSVCPSCDDLMNIKATYVAPPSSSPSSPASSGDEGGYVKGVVTYMVMDDLVVKPLSTFSSIALLSEFSVKDMGSIEEKVVELGFEEGLELLKASLKSKTVLTDVFFNNK